MAQACFRGRPASECHRFWITEFSLAYRLDDLPVEWVEWEDSNDYWLLAGEIGQMFNLSERKALGATVYSAYDGRRYRLGLKARGRHWFSRSLAADLGIGVLLLGDDSYYEPGFPAFAGHIGLMNRDLVGIALWLEVIPGKSSTWFSSEPTGTDVAIYAGVTGGSYIGTPALALVVLVAVAAVSGAAEVGGF
jgi:hypothetical protein